MLLLSILYRFNMKINVSLWVFVITRYKQKERLDTEGKTFDTWYNNIEHKKFTTTIWMHNYLPGINILSMRPKNATTNISLPLVQVFFKVMSKSTIEN